MIQRTLSKTQGRVFVALSQQKAELQRAYQEIQEAEAEQVEMLRVKYDLPEGRYSIRQEAGGEIVLFAVPEPEKAKPQVE
jgi:hypothetical protein